ncbi:MAG: SOUL family heme-binding protein [Hyphomicrobium sp.]
MAETQEPTFSVEEKDGDFEIRRYDPHLAAEVITTGERSTAINSGFRLLADFIFGNNRKPNQQMWTSDASQNAGQKIAMTVPVTQQPISEQPSGETWKVRFMMPKNFSLSTLPIPNNDRVKIKSEPTKRYAAVRFSGWSSESNLREHRQLLQNWISKKNLKSIGLPIYAFYNPPWSLPFLRRNECLIEIEQ